jgi:cytochrome b
MRYQIRSEAPAVPDEVIYRCIHVACARTLPRKVNFCPYCGTGQHAPVMNPAQVPVARIAPASPAPASAPASMPEPDAAGAQSSAAVTPAARPSGLGATGTAASPVRAEQPAARALVPARPPQREPVRLRYWLLALALLAAIWFTAKPGTKKIEARVGHAIALATECKFNEAQSELIALRSANATAEQLQRLQNALNDAVPACERKRARAKAWGETMLSVDGALASSAFDKAQGRLTAFTRRWGEDADTRAMKAKIAALREDARNPHAEEVIRRDGMSGARQAQSARNLVAEADRELAQGNYKAAAGKMETCVAMIDAGNRECLALKARAERLQQEMLRCVAANRDWIDDRCM